MSSTSLVVIAVLIVVGVAYLIGHGHGKASATPPVKIDPPFVSPPPAASSTDLEGQIRASLAAQGVPPDQIDAAVAASNNAAARTAGAPGA